MYILVLVLRLSALTVVLSVTTGLRFNYGYAVSKTVATIAIINGRVLRILRRPNFKEVTSVLMLLWCLNTNHNIYYFIV